MRNDLNLLSAAFTDHCLCTRCGTCIGVCPQSALSCDNDLFPRVDPSKCNLCGKCRQSCPGAEVSFRKLSPETQRNLSFSTGFDGVVLNTYVGYSNALPMRQNGSSGGVGTALMWSLLDSGEVDGCIVTRMDPSKPWIGQPFVAKSFEELIKSQGSRYTIIPLNTIFQSIVRLPGKYAYVGLPCQVHGFRKAAAIDPILRKKIHSVIGLQCGGALEPCLITEMLQTKKIKPEAIADFQFRGGEWPGKIRAIPKDGSKPVDLHYSNYKDGGYNYFIGMYMPKRCQTCIDGSNELSDLSVSDVWTKDASGNYKFKAHSRIIVRTRLGERIFEKAIRLGYLSATDVSGDPSYRTHKQQTKRKGIIAPTRIERLGKNDVVVPKYDRPTNPSTAKERLAERLVTATLDLCRFKGLRYPILKLLTSRSAIPLIRVRLFLKRRKYRKPA